MVLKSEPGFPCQEPPVLPALSRAGNGAGGGVSQGPTSSLSSHVAAPPSLKASTHSLSLVLPPLLSSLLLGKCPTNTFTLKHQSSMRAVLGRYGPGLRDSETQPAQETLVTVNWPLSPSKSTWMLPTKSGLCVEVGRVGWGRGRHPWDQNQSMISGLRLRSWF